MSAKKNSTRALITLCPRSLSASFKAGFLTRTLSEDPCVSELRPVSPSVIACTRNEPSVRSSMTPGPQLLVVPAWNNSLTCRKLSNRRTPKQLRCGDGRNDLRAFAPAPLRPPHTSVHFYSQLLGPMSLRP